MKSIRYRYGEDSFEWDAAKAEINAAKHGVDFAEAASAFDDFEAFITDDPNHSLGERREILVGYSLRKCLKILFSLIPTFSQREKEQETKPVSEALAQALRSERVG